MDLKILTKRTVTRTTNLSDQSCCSRCDAGGGRAASGASLRAHGLNINGFPLDPHPSWWFNSNKNNLGWLQQLVEYVSIMSRLIPPHPFRHLRVARWTHVGCSGAIHVALRQTPCFAERSSSRFTMKNMGTTRWCSVKSLKQYGSLMFFRIQTIQTLGCSNPTYTSTP